MSHKTILGGFAAAAVGLSMLGGALPATAASPTVAPASHSDYDHRHRNTCWDVKFFKHRGHWDVTYRDSERDGERTDRIHARTFRGAVNELLDDCDRFRDRGDRNRFDDDHRRGHHDDHHRRGHHDDHHRGGHHDDHGNKHEHEHEHGNKKHTHEHDD